MSAVLKSVPRRRRRTISQYLEVDISEFDDEDLIEELRERGIKESQTTPEIEDLWQAMAFKKHDRALELLREYLMNQTGRVLP